MYFFNIWQEFYSNIYIYINCVFPQYSNLFQENGFTSFIPPKFVSNKCMSLQSDCNYGLDDAVRFQKVLLPTRFATRTFLQAPPRDPFYLFYQQLRCYTPGYRFDVSEVPSARRNSKQPSSQSSSWQSDFTVWLVHGPTTHLQYKIRFINQIIIARLNQSIC